MSIKYLVMFLTLLACFSCTEQSKLDWEGCELEEPPHIKERKDSLRQLNQ